MLCFYSFVCGVAVTLFLTTYGKRLGKRGLRVFFAALLDSLMHRYNKVADEDKRKLFSFMSKDVAESKDKTFAVLEIGVGTGTNFKYYPKGTSIVCIEPNDSCESYVRKNIAELGDELVLKKFQVGVAENMGGVETESVDAVVSTLVLCSVRDVEQCLKEILRVLKPDGKFYFLEHIAYENTHPWFSMQKMLAPLQWFLFECRITQATHSIIGEAGFTRVERELIYMLKLTEAKPAVFGQWFKLITRHTVGIATK